VVIIEGCL